MSCWKVLAIVGMLAFFVLVALSLTGDVMLLLLAPAFGAANFSVLCLILDHLKHRND